MGADKPVEVGNVTKSQTRKEQRSIVMTSRVAWEQVVPVMRRGMKRQREVEPSRTD